MSAGAFTLIKAKFPAMLGKVLDWGPNGIEKTVAGDLCEGSFIVPRFNTIEQFAQLIANLTPSQVISSSLPLNGASAGEIVTKAKAAENRHAITRSKEHLGFPCGMKGLIPLDYDTVAGKPALSRDELWNLLTSIVPELKHAGVLWWSSSSSYIYKDGEAIYGLRGQRVYVMVADIGDTERVGKVLAKRLWLAAHGNIAISSSGQRLERTVFDAAMSQPGRLDFIGGAVCKPPLMQDRGTPVVLSNGDWLDTATAFKDLTPAEETQYAALVLDAKTKAEGPANEARERWKNARREAEVKKLSSVGIPITEAVERAERFLTAALGGVLLGDFGVPMADGSTISVGTILDNRERFHSALTLDPLEPEYANRKVTGKLFLYGATPTLHSFAHGGSTYRLRRQPHRLYLQRGKKAELVDEITKVLAGEPDVFLRGDALVLIEDGRMRQLRKHNLAHLIGTRTALYTKNEKGQDVAVDVPGDVVDMVIAVAEAN
jgi:hypothetical protein